MANTEKTMTPITSPENQIDWGPSPSPSPSPSISSRLPIDFSPPLIAMVVVVATAFFIVANFRLISRHLLPPIFLLLRKWRHRWLQWRHHSPSTATDIESHFHSSPPTYPFFSPRNGLDQEIIKTIPLSTYTTQKPILDCAVCLVEFQDNDYVRTLPVCSHSFHVECIDIWLTSHSNCPLCRAGIFRPDSPFIPLMAGRIRPSLDGILERIIINESIDHENQETEIVEDRSDFLLKRSYSFGYEPSLGADRIVVEAATATPWRYRTGNFWRKRPSSPLGKARVFSFRYYRGMNMKSPFFRPRSGLFPQSETNGRRFSSGVGSYSSRRTKSMATTSPMFMRSSGLPTFSSSRLRCGDLEALLSPERLSRR